MAPTPAVERGESNGRVGDLLHKITDDVKTIAKDQVELMRGEFQSTAKTAAAEAAVVLMGALVALIGFGMLCVVAVVALAPVIPALWLRLLLMAIVYLAVGGVIAGVFAKRLRGDVKPDLTVPAFEAKRTIAGVKGALQEGRPRG
jgi:hypothetical protein